MNSTQWKSEPGDEKNEKEKVLMTLLKLPYLVMSKDCFSEKLTPDISVLCDNKFLP